MEESEMMKEKIFAFLPKFVENKLIWLTFYEQYYKFKYEMDLSTDPYMGVDYIWKRYDLHRKIIKR